MERHKDILERQRTSWKDRGHLGKTEDILERQRTSWKDRGHLGKTRYFFGQKNKINVFLYICKN